MQILSQEQLNSRVNTIFSELFELKEHALRPEANLFTDLGLDSLDAIDLVISFQKEFKIRPENYELQSIRTVSDVYGLVQKYYYETTNHQ